MARKLLFYPVIILTPFFLLEGGARITVWAYDRWINPFEERRIFDDSVVTDRNVYLRYDFRKGRTGYVSYDRAHINEQGFRGESFDPVKQPDEFRVVCIGNSVTFGWGVSVDSLTYPARLQRRLQMAYPERSIRVINAGMPRFNSHDILGVLIQKVVPLQPDMVIVLSGWNDMEDLIVGIPDRPLPAGLYLSGPYVTVDRFLSWLADHSRFVNLMRRGVGYLAARLPMGGVSEREYEDLISALEDLPKNDRIDPAGVATFRRALETTVDVCRRHGIEPILLTWPHFFQPDLSMEAKQVLLGHMLKFPNLSYDGWIRVIDTCNTTIRNVAEAEGARCIDVARIGDHQLFRDAVHPTSEGYDRLAEKIVEQLPIE